MFEKYFKILIKQLGFDLIQNTANLTETCIIDMEIPSHRIRNVRRIFIDELHNGANLQVGIIDFDSFLMVSLESQNQIHILDV